MKNFLVKGGPVMIPIILGSIIGLGIIIAKLWSLRRVTKFDMDDFSNEVFKNLKSGKVKDAVASCDQNILHPLAVIFRAGIEKKDKPYQELERILERAGNNQVKILERYLGGLASIVAIEPLMGFLGTITGLIRAFMTWEQAGSNITVNALAGGIYEAMLTTAAGLMVAIPYYLFYNYIISRIKYISSDLTDYSLQLMEVLAEIKGGSKS